MPVQNCNFNVFHHSKETKWSGGGKNQQRLGDRKEHIHGIQGTLRQFSVAKRVQRVRLRDGWALWGHKGRIFLNHEKDEPAVSMEGFLI